MNKSEDVVYKFEPLWGAWKVEDFVGEGNYGKVYKIYREEWGQKYISALKLISIPQSQSDFKDAQSIGIDSGSVRGYFEDFVKNIVSEIELMYKLKGNSNIVSYEDHMIIKKEDEIGWHILIKMEFVQSLTDYIEKNEVNVADVVKLGIDICKALETCEMQNIIHRDIKDANIFVSKNGNFKLGDFGIARELSKSGRAASMRGTPLYMAPEVYKGESYDSTVDTYSLGIVMYKLLNKGRLPFMPAYPANIAYTDTEKAIERRMKGAKFEPPADAKDKLGQVVLKACSFKPRDRFKSPKEMRQALESIFNIVEEAADINTIEKLEISSEPNIKASISNKTLDRSIMEKDDSRYGRTVTIFDESANKEKEKFDEIFGRKASGNKKALASTENTDNVSVEADEEDDDIYDNTNYLEEKNQGAGITLKKLNPRKGFGNHVRTFIFITILLAIISSVVVMAFNTGAIPMKNKSKAGEKTNKTNSLVKTENYEIAKKQYDEGNYTGALDTITEELKINSENTEAICLQIDIKRKLSEMYMQEGIGFLKENKLMEAKESLEQAVLMYAPNTEAQEQLKKVNALVEQYVTGEKAEVIKAAKQLFASGKYNEAVAKLTKNIDDASIIMTYVTEWASELISKKEYTKALSFLTAASQANITSSSQLYIASLEVGKDSFSKGNYDAAIELFKAATNYTNSKGEVNDYIGNVYYKKAESLYIGSQTASLDCFVAAKNYGKDIDIKFAQGYLNTALAQLTSLKPQLAKLHNDRQMQNYSSKKDLLDKLNEIEELYETYNNNGNKAVYMNENVKSSKEFGEYTEAVKYIEAAINDEKTALKQ